MERQGLHGEDAASPDGTDHGNPLSGLYLDLGIAQTAKTVRAGHNLQRAIAAITIIDVKAQIEHLFEQIRRRLDMWLSTLDGPGAEACKVDTRLHGNDAILMPGQMPVGVRRLVEGENAHRPDIDAGQSHGKLRQQSGGLEEFLDGRR